MQFYLRQQRTGPIAITSLQLIEPYLQLIAQKWAVLPIAGGILGSLERMSDLSTQ